jgi:hypothetical protein
MAATLETVVGEIQHIKMDARNGARERPRWPMIVLRTPKGWTCPKESTAGARRTTGVPTRCRWVRCTRTRNTWMKSYRPTELFDDDGGLRTELAELPPRGERRMSANPHTNGGLPPRPGSVVPPASRSPGSSCHLPSLGPLDRRRSGHIYEIDDADTVDTSLWLPAEEVVICETTDVRQGRLISVYDIINTEDGGDKIWASRLR